MIDFVHVKITTAGFGERVHNNALLDFHTPINPRTGTMKNGMYEATYRGMKFTIESSGAVHIAGSLHKYHTDGIHNHTDFAFDGIQNVLRDLQQRFDIELSEAVMLSFEFGVNIALPFPTRLLLRSLIAFRYQSLDRIHAKHGKGKKSNAHQQHYHVKMYDKSYQYGLPYHLFRFELHVDRMCFANKYTRVKTLADFTEVVTFECLLVPLLNAIKATLIYEPMPMRLLSRSERQLQINGSNPLWWETLKPPNRCYHRQRFDALIERYGEHRYRATLRRLIERKWKDLCNRGRARLTNIERFNTLSTV